MDCKITQSLLSAYIDNEVSIENKSQLEQHLSGCPACRLELTSMQSANDYIKTMSPVKLPGDFGAKFWSRLRREESQRLPIIRWLPVPALCAAALIAVLSPLSFGSKPINNEALYVACRALVNSHKTMLMPRNFANFCNTCREKISGECTMNPCTTCDKK